ncbi:MAG: iron-containing alcohol dehydrogenase [Firmicutes bacterium]|nr:iron-containing alcohol dehydrogenase [Bacillota bacterium]
MENFEFKLGAKLYFGEGQMERLGEICKGLSMKHIMVVSGRHVSKLPLMNRLLENLQAAGMEYHLYCQVPNDPDVDAIDALADEMKAFGADGAVAIGGGSPMDAAKAACLLMTNPGKAEEYVFGGGKTATCQGIPLVCIPTTAGTGSEVTTASVLTNPRTLKKASIAGELLKPAAAIIDPVAMVDAPRGVTASTGMDALTHAIESYVCKKANPVSDLFAEKAIEIIGKYLIRSYEDGSDMEARGYMAVAANFAGIAIAHGGLGIVHGIAQSIGGVAGTAHGITNAVILPYAMKVNYEGNPAKYDRVRQLLGMEVEDLCKALSIPQYTKDLGVTEDMLPKILEETMAYRQLAVNPVVITEELAEKLIRQSFGA